MKLRNLFIAAFAVVFLASCGGGSDFCGCAETSLEMMKEMKEAGDDEAKQNEVKEKYKADVEACEKMAEDMQKEMEGLSDDEKKAKEEEMKKEMEGCDAYQEMQKMMMEEMQNAFGGEEAH